MKLKSGKELTHLEIIKRLNLMKINYDQTIKGKQFYIDLYDKEILSLENQHKIRKELEKDQKYVDFLSNNLRLTKEASLEFNIIKNNNKNNNNARNINKKYFFSDFNTPLFTRTILCCGTYNFIEKNGNLIKNNIMIPVNAFQKLSSAFIYPELNSVFKTLMNYVDNLNCNLNDYHCVYIIIIFVCLLVILLYFCNKYRKEKKAMKKERNPFSLY